MLKVYCTRVHLKSPLCAGWKAFYLLHTHATVALDNMYLAFERVYTFMWIYPQAFPPLKTQTSQPQVLTSGGQERVFDSVVLVL